MPLLVSDHSWTQTDSTVHIHVPLKGAKAEKVDIVSTDEYIKVHYPPYLFEAFLLEPVDDDRSSAKVGNGVAILNLMKRNKKVWNHLTINTDDKAQKKEIRDRALLKYQEKLSSESRSKKEKQQAEKKYALETMMRLEEEARDSVQKTKDAERARTTAELEAWQLRQRREAEDEAELRRQRDDLKALTEKQETGRNVKSGQSVREVKTQKKRADVPAPRRTGNIQVMFTPRVFPTALRESRVEEEEEWLRKQAEARRAVNPDVDELKDLKEEDRNPDFLKDKGDKYFAAGDFLSAVNVYNLAIRLNRQMPALFSNRAACHLKLRNLHKALEDSSKALDLLTPPVAANAAARARAHVRRGSAFCQLQLYAEGLQDYQAALKIDPHNEALQEDTRRIRDVIQGTETL
ncbi:dynein assembly factor 4, axonemal [Hippoglossus stenolepis]|uniref:dynein assembly factor 4, axonemal n=1 Tax=Hippoglossus stenolepis TaxID=195615 RepID=UPI00159C1A11|nr:dynein assembly factor 4, axonemal [Hippoglossus stenolepis]